MADVAIGSRAEAGSSSSRTSGSTAIARAMHRPLLLAARKGQRVLLQPVLHLVPESGAAQSLLDSPVEVLLHPEHTRAPGDVVVDRLRERIGLLEDHADAPPHLDRVDAGGVEVVALVEDLAVDPRARHEVVHAVQAADERALAAAGGPDHRRDDVPVDLQVDVADGRLLAVAGGQLSGCRRRRRSSRLALRPSAPARRRSRASKMVMPSVIRPAFDDSARAMPSRQGSRPARRPSGRALPPRPARAGQGRAARST